jgi:glutamine---fructose-6-phosphate transaminase (isomerizing)
MSGILAAFSDNNVIPTLFEGLQRFELEEADSDRISFATLMSEAIEQRHFVKKESDFSKTDFSSFLKKQTLSGSLSIVCFDKKQADQKYDVHLTGNEAISLCYHGCIDNLSEIREQLLQLGYELGTLSPSELILRFIRRYLDIKMSARDATLTAIKRLKGQFAIMVLFAQEKSLIVAQRGVSMVLGIKDNEIYIGSDSTALNYFVQPIMLLEEDSMLILRAFQKLGDFPFENCTAI